MIRRTAPAAAVVGLLGALTISSAASADSAISINVGNVPAVAATYADQECGASLGGGPYADQDVWVFNLPGSGSGDFVTVTATFTKPGGATTTIVIDAATGDGDGIVRQGTSKAWVATPDGWTLTGATANITGEANFFVLTHTCPAGGGGGSGSGSTPEATRPPTTGGPGPTSPAAPGHTPPAPGGLPVTGVAVGGMALTGAAMVLFGGIALWLMRRRRDGESAGT